MGGFKKLSNYLQIKKQTCINKSASDGSSAVLGCSSAVIRRIPGKQLLYSFGVCQVCIICLFQQPGQVTVWIQIVFNCGLDHAEYDRTTGGSLWRIGKQKVLPVYDKGFDASLCPVVAQF